MSTVSSSCKGTRHGNASAYNNYRCTCPDARADRERQRKTRHLRPGRIDVAGSRRRIHALMAIGWDLARIEAHAGYKLGGLRCLVYAQATVTTARADRICQVYDRLSMIPGPSATTRAAAMRARYVPPLAWDDDTIDDPRARPYVRSRPGPKVIDEVAVMRLMQGDKATPHTPAERRTAVHRLTAAGASAHVIAERIGRTADTVVRYRRTIPALALEGATA